MTTSVKIHVNGRYRATVVQKSSKGEVITSVVVEGNYEGSSNPSGEQTFWLPHPAHSTFEVKEEYLGEQSKTHSLSAESLDVKPPETGGI